MIIVIMLIGGFLGGLIAQNRGRNMFVWTVFCGIIPLMLLVLFALPRLPVLNQWRPCPYCLSIIPWSAQVCKVCRNDVPPAYCEPCNYCGKLVWAGMDSCKKCSNPAPWTDNQK